MMEEDMKRFGIKIGKNSQVTEMSGGYTCRRPKLTQSYNAKDEDFENG